LKILLFSASYPPPRAGGSVEYIYNIVSHLPAGSVVVHTGCGEPRAVERIDRSMPQRTIRSWFISSVIDPRPRHPFDRGRALLQYALWPLAAIWLILREKPDVVHLGEANIAGLAAALMGSALGKPYLLYSYAEEITTLRRRRLHRWWLQVVLLHADAHVAVSHYTRSLLIEQGVAPERIRVVLPAIGVEKRRATTIEEREKILRKYRLRGRRVLLTVGRLVERKNHSVVLDALRDIRRVCPEACYVIVGIGPEEEALRRKVRGADLDEVVCFAGLVEDAELACLYDLCDVFVMPHREVPATADTEGCPTVFLEASARGKPVVGGKAGGVADAILDGTTGYVIDGRSAAAVADCVIRLLTDDGLARRMGEEGQRYTAAMTPESNAGTVLRISRELAERNGRSAQVCSDG
jgi:phosphatidyl-myo-inositol dimannoside synthase